MQHSSALTALSSISINDVRTELESEINDLTSQLAAARRLVQDSERREAQTVAGLEAQIADLNSRVSNEGKRDLSVDIQAQALVRKLREIFDLCSSTNTGILNKMALAVACQRMRDVAAFFHLQEQIQLEDGSRREAFEWFFQQLDDLVAQSGKNGILTWEAFQIFYARRLMELSALGELSRDEEELLRHPNWYGVSRGIREDEAFRQQWQSSHAGATPASTAAAVKLQRNYRVFRRQNNNRVAAAEVGARVPGPRRASIEPAAERSGKIRESRPLESNAMQQSSLERVEIYSNNEEKWLPGVIAGTLEDGKKVRVVYNVNGRKVTKMIHKDHKHLRRAAAVNHSPVTESQSIVNSASTSARNDEEKTLAIEEAARARDEVLGVIAELAEHAPEIGTKATRADVMHKIDDLIEKRLKQQQARLEEKLLSQEQNLQNKVESMLRPFENGLLAQSGATQSSAAQATEVGYIDKEGDRVAFSIENGKLIMFVNGERCAEQGDSSGVVTKLIYKPGEPADVRTQSGWGNSDFPVSLVKELKEMADSILVPHNLHEALVRDFNVVLEKHANVKSLGLRLNNETLRINLVRDGLVQIYNDSVEADKQVRIGDHILEVNGYSGDIQKMLQVLRGDSKRFNLLVRRNLVGMMTRTAADNDAMRLLRGAPEKRKDPRDSSRQLAAQVLANAVTLEKPPAEETQELAPSVALRELASAVFACHASADVAFEAFDAGGSGRVSINEFRVGLQALFPVRFKGDVESVFQELDELGTGILMRKQLRVLDRVFAKMMKEDDGFIYIDEEAEPEKISSQDNARQSSEQPTSRFLQHSRALTCSLADKKPGKKDEPAKSVSASKSAHPDGKTLGSTLSSEDMPSAMRLLADASLDGTLAQKSLEGTLAQKSLNGTLAQKFTSEQAARDSSPVTPVSVKVDMDPSDQLMRLFFLSGERLTRPDSAALKVSSTIPPVVKEASRVSTPVPLNSNLDSSEPRKVSTTSCLVEEESKVDSLPQVSSAIASAVKEASRVSTPVSVKSNLESSVPRKASVTSCPFEEESTIDSPTQVSSKIVPAAEEAIPAHSQGPVTSEINMSAPQEESSLMKVESAKMVHSLASLPEPRVSTATSPPPPPPPVLAQSCENMENTIEAPPSAASGVSSGKNSLVSSLASTLHHAQVNHAQVQQEARSFVKQITDPYMEAPKSPELKSAANENASLHSARLNDEILDDDPQICVVGNKTSQEDLVESKRRPNSGISLLECLGSEHPDDVEDEDVQEGLLTFHNDPVLTSDLQKDFCLVEEHTCEEKLLDTEAKAEDDVQKDMLTSNDDPVLTSDVQKDDCFLVEEQICEEELSDIKAKAQDKIQEDLLTLNDDPGLTSDAQKDDSCLVEEMICEEELSETEAKAQDDVRKDELRSKDDPVRTSGAQKDDFCLVEEQICEEELSDTEAKAQEKVQEDMLASNDDPGLTSDCCLVEEHICKEELSDTVAKAEENVREDMLTLNCDPVLTSDLQNDVCCLVEEQICKDEFSNTEAKAQDEVQEDMLASNDDPGLTSDAQKDDCCVVEEQICKEELSDTEAKADDEYSDAEEFEDDFESDGDTDTGTSARGTEPRSPSAIQAATGSLGTSMTSMTSGDHSRSAVAEMKSSARGKPDKVEDNPENAQSSRGFHVEDIRDTCEDESCPPDSIVTSMASTVTEDFAKALPSSVPVAVETRSDDESYDSVGAQSIGLDTKEDTHHVEHPPTANVTRDAMRESSSARGLERIAEESRPNSAESTSNLKRASIPEISPASPKSQKSLQLPQFLSPMHALLENELPNGVDSEHSVDKTDTNSEMLAAGNEEKRPSLKEEWQDALNEGSSPWHAHRGVRVLAETENVVTENLCLATAVSGAPGAMGNGSTTFAEKSVVGSFVDALANAAADFDKKLGSEPSEESQRQTISNWTPTLPRRNLGKDVPSLPPRNGSSDALDTAPSEAILHNDQTSPHTPASQSRNSPTETPRKPSDDRKVNFGHLEGPLKRDQGRNDVQDFGGIVALRKLASAVFATHPNAEVAFDAFDIEGRGKVTIKEFKAGCQALFPVRFEGNTDQVFKELDDANNGFIMRKQFKDLATIFEDMLKEDDGFIYIDDEDDSHKNFDARKSMAICRGSSHPEVEKARHGKTDQSQSFNKERPLRKGSGTVSLPALSRHAFRHTFGGSWGHFDMGLKNEKRLPFATAEKYRPLRGKIFLSGTDGFAGMTKQSAFESSGRVHAPLESLDHRSPSLQMSGKLQTVSSCPRLRVASR